MVHLRIIQYGTVLQCTVQYCTVQTSPAAGFIPGQDQTVFPVYCSHPFSLLHSGVLDCTGSVLYSVICTVCTAVHCMYCSTLYVLQYSNTLNCAVLQCNVLHVTFMYTDPLLCYALYCVVKCISVSVCIYGDNTGNQDTQIHYSDTDTVTHPGATSKLPRYTVSSGLC